MGFTEERMRTLTREEQRGEGKRDRREGVLKRVILLPDVRSLQILFVRDFFSPELLNEKSWLKNSTQKHVQSPSLPCALFTPAFD
jgi:hypothetical protein